MEGFFFELEEVTGEVELGKDGLGEVEAGPGAPSPQCAVRARHAEGEVLKMANGIPDELLGWSLGEIPDEG